MVPSKPLTGTFYENTPFDPVVRINVEGWYRTQVTVVNVTNIWGAGTFCLDIAVGSALQRDIVQWLYKHMLVTSIRSIGLPKRFPRDHVPRRERGGEDLHFVYQNAETQKQVSQKQSLSNSSFHSVIYPLSSISWLLWPQDEALVGSWWCSLRASWIACVVKVWQQRHENCRVASKISIFVVFYCLQGPEGFTQWWRWRYRVLWYQQPQTWSPKRPAQRCQRHRTSCLCWDFPDTAGIWVWIEHRFPSILQQILAQAQVDMLRDERRRNLYLFSSSHRCLWKGPIPPTSQPLHWLLLCEIYFVRSGNLTWSLESGLFCRNVSMKSSIRLLLREIDLLFADTKSSISKKSSVSLFNKRRF